MEHIKLFENYRLEESYALSAAVLQGLARDVIRTSDTEDIAEMLFLFFAGSGMPIDKEGLGAPFGSDANAVYNTVDILSKCRNFEEAYDEIGKLWLMLSKESRNKY
jgi:hypothetical protein